ncbi:MAG: hypothetical protein ACP5I3_11885 [Thermoproteus sp.]
MSDNKSKNKDDWPEISIIYPPDNESKNEDYWPKDRTVGVLLIDEPVKVQVFKRVDAVKEGDSWVVEAPECGGRGCRIVFFEAWPSEAGERDRYAVRLRPGEQAAALWYMQDADGCHSVLAAYMAREDGVYASTWRLDSSMSFGEAVKQIEDAVKFLDAGGFDRFDWLEAVDTWARTFNLSVDVTKLIPVSNI